MNDDATAGRCAPEEERAELETVLASGSFSRAPALSRLLTYVCGQYLAGRGEFLKEYTVGTEALGRGANFDPDHDSVVRVMATRLRKRLAAYYAEEGADHKLRIQLPESGYSPKFVRNPATVNGAAEIGAPEVPVLSRSRWRWSMALLVLTFGAIVAAAVFRPSASAVLPLRGPASYASAGVAAAGSEYLVNVGSGEDYRDADGRIWQADRYCSGGTVRSSPERRILRSADPEPYRSGRRVHSPATSRYNPAFTRCTCTSPKS